MLRIIQNRIKMIIHNAVPRFEKGPRSQLQGGILGYLYHHRDGPVYQRDLEKEFRISRATATNTLQVMERDGLIVQGSGPGRAAEADPDDGGSLSESQTD